MPSKSYLMGRCPPGVICITPATILICLLLLCVVILVAIFFQQPTTMKGKEQIVETSGMVAPSIAVQVATSQGDDRFSRAPKPERHWVTRTEIPTPEEIYGKLPRVPTRGIPETYQSMGVITMEDGQVLPLYGRRTASRSDRFQYYTRTDTFNPVQLPIRHKRRDCQEDIGCEELFNGESISVSPTGQRGAVTIYRFDGPTYVPGIL
jgi:hypothetical protein